MNERYCAICKHPLKKIKDFEVCISCGMRVRLPDTIHSSYPALNGPPTMKGIAQEIEHGRRLKVLKYASIACGVAVLVIYRLLVH